jgi:hypothetical protein
VKHAEQCTLEVARREARREAREVVLVFHGRIALAGKLDNGSTEVTSIPAIDRAS